MKKLIILLILSSCFAHRASAVRLGEISEIAQLEVDSINYSILPESIMLCASIQRDTFDEWRKISSTKTLSEKSEIKEVIDAFKACTVESILPYKTDKLSKYMKIKKIKGYYCAFWFNEENIDVRCRVLIFSRGKIIVSWLGETGLLDFDGYRCSNGALVLTVLRRLL